jgi:hypothetical protein
MSSHSAEISLFIVMHDQCQDTDHLAIAAGTSQHLVLQLPKGQRLLAGTAQHRWRCLSAIESDGGQK